MAQIVPFAGIHFDPKRVPLADVIAPPYDVLSPAQQEALYAQHPANIVRLMLNKEQPDDDAAHNRYTRAADFLQACLADGTMAADKEPALYEYIQIFEHPLQPERKVERRTLFVALKLEPYANGVVLPHEETHPKAKADRLNLMRATHSNPEPIYGLYEDPTLTVAKSLDAVRTAEPFLKAVVPGKTGPDAEQHLVYRHTDACLLSDLEEFFASRRVWIADGHHRYETGLNYRNEVRGGSEDGPARPADYLLIGLSAFEDPGLVVLPTHRLVKNIPQARMEQLALQLDRYFHVRPLPLAAAREWIKAEVPGETRFVVLTQQSHYALTLRDPAQAEAAM